LIAGGARITHELAKELGYDVSVIAPLMEKQQKKRECIDGIFVYRHFSPVEASSKFSFFFEYGNALLWEFLFSIFIYITSQ